MMTKYHRPGQDGLRLFANQLSQVFTANSHLIFQGKDAPLQSLLALEAGGGSHAFLSLYDYQSQPDLFKRWRQFRVKVNSMDLGMQRLWAGILALQH